MGKGKSFDAVINVQVSTLALMRVPTVIVASGPRVPHYVPSRPVDAGGKHHDQEAESEMLQWQHYELPRSRLLYGERGGRWERNECCPNLRRICWQTGHLDWAGPAGNLCIWKPLTRQKLRDAPRTDIPPAVTDLKCQALPCFDKENAEFQKDAEESTGLNDEQAASALLPIKKLIVCPSRKGNDPLGFSLRIPRPNSNSNATAFDFVCVHTEH
ncbi:uncharacterized protein V6R79_013509 [Siganus canaliculatus]